MRIKVQKTKNLYSSKVLQQSCLDMAMSSDDPITYRSILCQVAEHHNTMAPVVLHHPPEVRL